MVTRGFQHGTWRIIEHGSYRTVLSNAVRHVFSNGGRIFGCRIVYVIFLNIIIASLIRR